MNGKDQEKITEIVKEGKMNKKEIAALLDKELEKNEELKKAIGNDKKKREAYIEKYFESENQLVGNPVIKKVLCSTCVFSKSPVLQENGPMKGWCRIYSKDLGVPKPLDIVYDNGDCLYYRKEEA